MQELPQASFGFYEPLNSYEPASILETLELP